ncbi:MAG: Uma2 family endonuclease [Methylococcus sp.]
MQWQDVIDNPYLKDLPFKIELNRWGRIEMSPASNRHALLQSRLAQWIRAAMGNGETLTEASIQTSDGVRVPDVVWASDAFLAQHDFETPFSQAPDICVEVISPANSRLEMLDKTRLYLEAGATEVWLVSDTGKLEVEDAGGAREDSRLAPGIREILQRQCRRCDSGA